MKLSRRGFLKASAATGIGAVGLTACSTNKPVLDNIEEQQPVGTLAEGKWIPTGCAGCTSWCASEAFVVDGRVIKTRGNPRSKVNGKSACPRMHLAVQQVYDPDRIKTPMKRTNPKKGRNEDPRFVSISWDEAMDAVAEKIMELRRNKETHKLAIFRGRYTQLNELPYSRIPGILGTPNNISHSSICAEAEKFGPFYTEGYWNYRDYDVANTKYVICWGADPLSTNRQVSHYLNAWGNILEQAKVATVEPRLTATASKSHEWLPVRSGEDGAVAIAMAHVILVEGLWSREFVGEFKDGQNKFILGAEVAEEDFVEKHTNGIVKWWNLELKDKTPEWAEERSGVSAEQIRRVAIDFAKAAPYAMVFMGGGGVMQNRGAYNAMAIHALNGLVGSVDHKGGTIQGASVAHQALPSNGDFIDEIAAAGNKNPKIDQRGYKAFPALNGGRSGGGVVTNRVADAILDEDPYELKMVMAYWCNFNYACPESDRWDRAMAKLPFLVHCVTHISEMSHFADILLPSTHHMFEQWGYLSQKGNGFTHAWLARPLIQPLWGSKNFESQIMWLLGEKLAEKGFANMLEYMKTIVDPETEKAPTNGEELELYMTKFKLQPAWDPNAYRSGDKLNGWDELVEKGVWNSGEYPFKGKWDNFNTVTKKFEFYSETLKKALQGHADRHNTNIDDILKTCNYLARGEMAFVPHYEEPLIRGDAREYPLVFVDQKARLNREGRSANCSWYQDFRDLDFGDMKWGDTVKLNPVDARRLGITHRDRVRVISPFGKNEAVAFVWEGIVPGMIAKSFGQGHWSYGNIADGIGSNNNELLPADYERLSGSTVFYAATRVRIEKL